MDEKVTKETEARVPLAEARSRAEQVVAVIDRWADRVDVAGSVRRGRPLVKDIDIVCQLPPEAVDPLTRALQEAGAVFESQAPVTWVFFWAGVKVELYLADEELYAMRLLWRTGSAQHNARMACLAKKHGKMIRRNGVLDGETEERLAWRSEGEIFGALGLPFVPPEKREA